MSQSNFINIPDSNSGGSSGVTSINGATGVVSVVTGTTGTDFNILSFAGTIVLNIPNASSINRGLLIPADWTTFNNKQNSLTFGNISTSTTGVTVGSGSNSTVGPNVTIDIQTASGSQTGLLSSTDWTTFNSKQPAGSYVLTTRTINTTAPLTGGGDLSADRTFAMPVATSLADGFLSSTDWSTFNSKQPAGSYITSLTTDITASGPGAAAATLATVNANVGSFGSSTSIPSFTVNAKGLITAASGNVVIAPAGTLTGTTLASNVVSSSLTSVGTLTSLTVSGTIAASNFSGSSSGTNTGDITLTAFGSTPNANGASLTGQALNLEPASATRPGGVSTTTQTLAGDKTLSGTTDLQGTSNLASNAASVATVGNASSTAKHRINGGIQYTTKTITATTYTADTTTADRVIYTDSTSNAITITLPPPTNGRFITVQDKTGKAATNNITVVRNSTETINGLTQIVIAQNYNGVTFISDGTNWVATFSPTSGNAQLTAGTTYTTPININPQTRFKFTIIGAGGAGAGVPTTNNAKGSGGGAGGTAIVYLTGLAANTAYTTAIGAAGTGTANAAGGNGGNTTILINAVTYTASGGTGGPLGQNVNGGAGGTTTNATIGLTGSSGGGVNNAGNQATSGRGGDSLMGMGGASVGSSTNQAGIIATGFGGGGGGASQGGTSAGTFAGGNGTQGAIFVEWNN